LIGSPLARIGTRRPLREALNQRMKEAVVALVSRTPTRPTGNISYAEQAVVAPPLSDAISGIEVSAVTYARQGGACEVGVRAGCPGDSFR
jgi:hypothetical protein